MLLLRYFYEQKQFVFFSLAILCFMCFNSYLPSKWKYGIRIPARNNRLLFTRSVVTVYSPLQESKNKNPLIAIGGGITSRKIYSVNESNIGKKFQFFQTFMLTFCRTASRHFVYMFYLGYDYNDRVFANQRLRDAFLRHFHFMTTSGSCSGRHITANLSLLKCEYSGRPTWSQNDAMLEAYLDNADYFYRVNDDTMMLTGGWPEMFISALERYDPPRVGVVGPTHYGGNIGILTYDFVHRTHIDIFGFYYPHWFSDWWGDNWITRVYRPRRSTKIRQVRLVHTMKMGRRYSIHWRALRHLNEQLAHGKDVINR